MKNFIFNIYCSSIAVLFSFGCCFTIQAQCFKPLGSSTNALSMYWSNLNQIVVNNQLNTLVFIHRNNSTLPGSDNGIFKYDISTDNGNNWAINQGNLNPSSNNATNGGRYPQAAIYNPPGNTDVAQSKLVYYGPTIGGGLWQNYVSGTLKLDGISAATENYNQAGVASSSVPGGLCQGVPGTFWTTDILRGSGVYYDKLRVLKGVDNGTDIVWSENAVLSANFDTSYLGSPRFADWNMAFDPSGMKGWVVLLSHLTDSYDYVFYPILYKTTNGGISWEGPIQLEPKSFPNISNLLQNPACSYEADIAVDVNGNPHVVVGVFEQRNAPYTINERAKGYLCDFNLDGNTWKASIISQIGFSRTNFNFGQVDNRPQISRSDDGRKLVYTWAETTLFPTGPTSNLRAVTYDVPTKIMSCPKIYSYKCPSMLDNNMFLNTTSPILMEKNGVYTVPIVIGALNSSYNGLEPVNYFYINDFTYTEADFVAGPGTVFPTISSTPDNLCAPGETVNLTANSNSKYLWNTGETTQTIAVQKPTDYWVVNPDINFCLSNSNTRKVLGLRPPFVYTIEPTDICPGKTIDLHAYFFYNENQAWNTGQTTRTITVGTPGSYYATDKGCKSETIEIVYTNLLTNDFICNASSLTMGVAMPFNNKCATSSVGEPVPPTIFSSGLQNGWLPDDGTSSYVVLDNTVWFKFIAPNSGAVNISSTFNEYPHNTQLALYSSSDNSCSGSLTLIAANDDVSDNDYNSFINQAYCLIKGNTYFVQLDGFAGFQGAGTVLVSPVQVADALPISQTICSGNPISPIVLSSILAGATFDWTRDNVATVTGIQANGTGDISGTLTNTSSAPVTVNFTIIPKLPTSELFVYNETFPAVLPVGDWAQQNLSSPLGIAPSWFKGNTGVFSGRTDADYLGVNYESVDVDPVTGEGNTISNWLFTPNQLLKNGDKFSFWTRTVDNPGYADRLQVRMSTHGASVNAGVSNVSTGDFSTLLLDINPTYDVTGFPNAWTKYSITLSGLPGAGVSGRIAFRYFVENGGLLGDNSDYIGIDDVVYTTINTCNATPITATVLVNPIPTVSAMSNQTVCNNSSTLNMNFGGAAEGTVFNWINNLPSIGLPASGTGNIASFIASNNTTGQVTATITVTPTFTNSGVICTGNPISFTIQVNPSPVASISVANANDFCYGITINANSTHAGMGYEWHSPTHSLFATSQSINLNNSNKDGTYSAFVIDDVGCRSVQAATYNYQKQNILGNYIVLGTKSVKLGKNNMVNGSVGNTTADKKVEIDKNSTIYGFVKAGDIKLKEPVTVIGGTFNSPATLVLPAMLFNVAVVPKVNFTVPDNAVGVIINTHYDKLTIGKNASVTVNGTIYGKVQVKEGARVTFTKPDISIDELNLDGGKSGSNYTTVIFNGSVVRIKNKVTIDDRCRVNSSIATFYMGDATPDNEKFKVNGQDTRVTANVYMPAGKMDVKGSASGLCVMTGMFISQDISSDDFVTWNGFDCGTGVVPTHAPFVTTGINMQGTVLPKVSPVTADETFEVKVSPNPSVSEFNIRVMGSSKNPIVIRIMDAAGIIHSTSSHVANGSVLTVGRNLIGGTYFAEVIQGNNRKVVKIVKLK